MAAIQGVYVRGHEERTTPKSHIVYCIEVQTSVQSWQVWHRYSEFVDLHNQLSKSTGAEPPAHIPPKHIFSFRKNDEAILEERRTGLEGYLRAIVSSKDGQWRESPIFNDFLGVIPGKHTATGRDLGSQFTLLSWLDEHAELQALLRDIRADVNKRNSLLDMGDISASHVSNVQAKKKLVALLDRVGTLAVGLETLRTHGMPQGELQRRSDMVARLQDDYEKLGKMVIAVRQVSRRNGGAGQGSSVSQSDRTALLSSSTRPVTRVFGSPPQETDKTRPLDDRGLLQLQKTQIEEQDNQLSQITDILRRQRQLGLTISQEIEEQNELLDDLSRNVDVVGGKLSAANKTLRRLE